MLEFHRVPKRFLGQMALQFACEQSSISVYHSCNTEHSRSWSTPSKFNPFNLSVAGLAAPHGVFVSFGFSSTSK